MLLKKTRTVAVGCENGANMPSHAEKHLGTSQVSPASCTSVQTSFSTRDRSCTNAARMSGAIAWIAHESTLHAVIAITWQ